MTDIDWDKIHRNEFARRCFLVPADYDYISCRTLYRNECFDQFLYLGHQSIEKYLKAILLYNNISSKDGRHDLERLLKKCLQIGHFQIDKDLENFIKNFNGYDDIRYLTYNYSAESSYLTNIDKTIWQIRRYAQNNYYPGRKTVFNGELEKILKNNLNKFKKLRENLIWKNSYYCTYKKNKIKRNWRMWAKNTPLFMHQDMSKNKDKYDAVKELVYLPKEVRKQFEKL